VLSGLSRRGPIAKAGLAALTVAMAMFLAMWYPGGGTAAAAIPGELPAAEGAAQVSELPVALDTAEASAEAGVVADINEVSDAAALPQVPTRTSQGPVSAAYQPADFTVLSSVPFTQPVDCGDGQTCQVRVDIYVPSGRGTFPVVILVGPSGRGYLASFAADLARLGVLVFNADFRDVADSGGGYPAAFEDVACAVRFARSDAGRYGGDAGPVTLVGHSLGGWVGSVVALDETEFEGGCLADGSGRPDAFVGLSGNYQIAGGENAADLYPFFGGSATATAKARAASDPFNFATGTAIPVRLVAGTADETVDPAQSKALDAFLLRQGWNVALTLVPDGSHMSIVSGQSAFDAVFSAMSAAKSTADTIDQVKGRLGQ
jgi:acetyl esterase/lipase